MTVRVTVAQLLNHSFLHAVTSPVLRVSELGQTVNEAIL